MWSVRIRLLCFYFLIFNCKKSQSLAVKQSQIVGRNSTTSNSSVKSILEFLDDHIDEFKFAKNKAIVFVIVAADSNPMTLISLITGAELEVIETEPNSGVFMFVDKDGPLNQYSENVVPDLIPQLLTDKERGVDYYILPNFRVATDVRSDLAVWHLIQRSLQFATEVKFMLTLSYTKLQQRQHHTIEAQQEVRQLARDATSLINDIEKYSNAISLTVTNVENDPRSTDINEIQDIVFLILSTIDSITSELNESTPEESKALKKDISCLKILLNRNDDDEYTKIKIMRLANETGLVHDMAIFQNEKVEIMSMVRSKNKYITTDENDFSFNISNETKTAVPELVEEIEQRMSADISIIEKAFQNIYSESEEKYFDLNVLLAKMSEGYQVISQIQAVDPRSLVEQVMRAAAALKIEISFNILDDLLRHTELYYFLIPLEERHLKSNFFRAPQGLEETTKYLQESMIWYEYLLNLHDTLSEYKVQLNVKKYESNVSHVTDLCTIDKHEERNVTDIGLKELLELIGVTQPNPEIENMKVNSFKLKILKQLLHRTMHDYGTKICYLKKLLVQGYNVKMSDVMEMNCPGEIQFREIFVMNKLFIDANFEAVGLDLQLMIMAPTWEIVGGRSITVNGKDGESHISEQAVHGGEENVNGAAGKSGKSGFSAGCFTAIGNKFINDEHLQIHLTGGRGGPGQRDGDGSVGLGGKGGIGGKRSTDGAILRIGYADEQLFGFTGFNEGEVYPKGADGESDKNDSGIKEPDSADFIHLSHSVNRYISYLIDNLAENIRESSIRAFIGELEAKESIRSLYDTMGFVNRLETLENQYLRLRNKISFFQFYKSLKDRIGEYASSNSENDDYQKVLTFLHTSVMGKLFHLKNAENNFKNHISIVDLSEHLKIVQKNIRKMGEIEKEVTITDQTEEYQKSLQDKITSAIELVNREVVPVLSRLFEPLGREIGNLLGKVITNRDRAQAELNKLAQQLRNEQFIAGLKTVGSIAKVFGSVGLAVGTFMDISTSVTWEAMDALSKLSSGLNKLTNPLTEVLKAPFRVFLEQLKWMDDIPVSQIPLDYNINSLNDVKQKISDLKGKLETSLAKSEFYQKIKEVYNMRLDLGIHIANASKNCTFTCQALGQMEKVNKMKKVGLDLWNEIKGNYAKVEELYDQHMQMEKELNKWDARMQQITDVMILMLFEVEETAKQAVDVIANKTQFELDITSWKIQSSMSDFKLLVRQMSEETNLQDNINQIVEKIKDAFGTMVVIYDRIQSLMDQSKLARLYADLQSPNKRGIADLNLRNVVMQLERVLQSNLVLEQYDVAMHAFKQHFFPFASIHLANFDLSAGLKVNDTEVLVRRASEEIDYLIDEVKFSKLGRLDREIFGEINFNGNNISIARPFYIFGSREFKDLFNQLLRGEEIMIKADITRGLSQNAVKFDRIGIELKLIDEQMQDEFDAQLQYFGVRMTLIGEAYYKCGDRFYSLSGDDSVVIEYSFRKNSDGKPIKFNEVYRKLSENHYFLSPYATWKIQLIDLDKDFALTSAENAFKKLEKLTTYSFNLELVGRGQYFRSNGTLEAEICTDEVGKYFELDKSLSGVMSTRSLKHKYLPLV